MNICCSEVVAIDGANTAIISPSHLATSENTTTRAAGSETPGLPLHALELNVDLDHDSNSLPRSTIRRDSRGTNPARISIEGRFSPDTSLLAIKEEPPRVDDNDSIDHTNSGLVDPIHSEQVLLAAKLFLTSVPLLSIHEMPGIARRSPGHSRPLTWSCMPAHSSLAREHNPSTPCGEIEDMMTGYDLERALIFLTSIDSCSPWTFDDREHSKPRLSEKNLQRIPLNVLKDHAVLERSFIRKGLLGSNVILSDKRSPFYCFSTLPPTSRRTPSTYAANLGGRPLPYGVTFIDEIEPVRKYGLLQSWWCIGRNPAKGKSVGTSFASLLTQKGNVHDPFVLDNPRARVHATTSKITTLSLESYTISVIPFARPRRIKEEDNDFFAKKHPWLHKSLTLSKMRNLKQDLLNIGNKFPTLDISTVASAWVYFERLVMKKVVHKGNRKLMAGVCLVLAYKFNQQEFRDGKEFRRFATCIREMDRKDRLNISDIREAEFRVFTLLGFELHLDPQEVGPQLDGFLSMQETTLAEYYGDSWISNIIATGSEELGSRSLSRRGRFLSKDFIHR